MIYYLIASILIAVAALFARTKRAVLAAGILFYAVQIAAAGLLLWGGLYDTTSAAFFTFDALGTQAASMGVDVRTLFAGGHGIEYHQTSVVDGAVGVLEATGDDGLERVARPEAQAARGP